MTEVLTSEPLKYPKQIFCFLAVAKSNLFSFRNILSYLYYTLIREKEQVAVFGNKNNYLHVQNSKLLFFQGTYIAINGTQISINSL